MKIAQLIEIELALRDKETQEQAIAKYSVPGGLSLFVKDAWHVLEPHTPYTHGWVIDAMCDHYEAIHTGEIKRLLINVPPGCMKSLLTNVFFSAWEWGPKQCPYLKNIGTSFSEGNAIRDNVKLRYLITSEWYQERFGHLVQLQKDQNEKKKFENTAFGFQEVCAFGSMTGKRGDRVKVDDPHNVKDAESQNKRETAANNFFQSVTTRLISPSNSAIIVIMQRLNAKDLSGLIKDRGEDYVILELPMEFIEKRRCSTKIGFSDPRTKEGELLFIERYPAKIVESLKKEMGSYAAAGQLQQTPSPAEGGLIERDFWLYYSEMPKQFDKTFIVVDSAKKIEEQHDFSVMQCYGVVGDKCYLIDQIRKKLTAPALNRQAVKFWEKHKGGGNVGFQIEDKASGTGLIQFLEEEKIPAKKLDSKWTCINKYARVEGKCAMIEQGRCILPMNAPFTQDIVDECAEFPNGAYDDQVDCIIYAMFFLVHNECNLYKNWKW